MVEKRPAEDAALDESNPPAKIQKSIKVVEGSVPVMANEGTEKIAVEAEKESLKTLDAAKENQAEPELKNGVTGTGPQDKPEGESKDPAPAEPVAPADKKDKNNTANGSVKTEGQGNGENAKAKLVQDGVKVNGSATTAPTPTPASAIPTSAPAPASTTAPPPGVPTGIPVGIPIAAPTAIPQSQPIASTPNMSAQSGNIVEKCDLPMQFVGRIIGKGGEQIRDLQARSACKVDVDQNVPQNAPRVITYQGPRDKIDFAKSLVAMLCTDNWKNAELPLGFASRVQLQVPSTVIGKIIGKGGEMIKELQSKSYAKIQVDHSSGADTGTRTVTVTGNELSVKRGEEMIKLIIANPMADASNAVDMLIREKSNGTSEWGSGPPYVSMPNNGQGMTNNGGGYGQQSYGQYGQQQQTSQYGGGYGSYGQQRQPQQQPAAQGYNHYGSSAGGGGGLESEIFYSAKMYMGRIIGQKGVTINDLQKRSGCDIQINQNVPVGQDCEINIKGTRQGIETAKQMLNDIISMGSTHPYAGGHGGGGGGGGGGYQKPQQQQQQYGGYGHQQAYGQYPQQQQNHYQQPQQPLAYQAPYVPQQQPIYGGYQQPQQQAIVHPQAQPQQGYGYQPPQQQLQQPQYGAYQQQPAPVVSEWKAAKAPDGQTYYYNEKTNATTWDKPAGMP